LLIHCSCSAADTVRAPFPDLTVRGLNAAATTNPVAQVINNIGVTPGFAGLSEAGLFQINLTVRLLAQVGSYQTQANVVISS
jgi:hypothetical protein